MACVLLGLPACAANSASSADYAGHAPYEEPGMAAPAAEADMGYSTVAYDDEMAEEAPIAMSTTTARSMDEAEPVRQKRVFGKRRGKAKSSAPQKNEARPEAPTPPEPSAAEEGGADSAEPQQADEQPPEAEVARHIVYTAGMRIAVFNLQDALAAAEGIPDRYGGYVQTMTDTQVVLRIPSKNLRTVMGGLSGYGNVEQRWLRSQDVTAEFTDLASRLKALEKTHAQLLELLGTARTVAEALQVRQALDQVSAELEIIKGRLRQLENMTTYSTLTLDFYERGPHTPVPSSNDPFPWVDSLGVENTEWK